MSVTLKVLLAKTYYYFTCDSLTSASEQKLFFQLTFTDAVHPNDQTKILPQSLSRALTDRVEADSERKNLVLLLAPLDSRLACESQ